MNILLIVAGIISATAGITIYFTASRTAGIIFMIIGVSLLVIGGSISRVFYTIEMTELMENNRRNKK
jgi:uncharacterized membrane protein HdeD (DUF308 family)